MVIIVSKEVILKRKEDKADNLKKEICSMNMSHIRSKETKPVNFGARAEAARSFSRGVTDF